MATRRPGLCNADRVDKEALRRELRAGRRTRGPAHDGPALARVLDDLMAGLGVASPLTLAGYLPARGEPDVGPCLARWWHNGDAVVVPRTLPDCRLEWVPWSPDAELVADRHGLRAPAGRAEPELLDRSTAVILVPALGADRMGMRLGHGAGYYDRELALRPRWPEGPLRIAVVHAEGLLTQPIPHEDHDQPVDAALTAVGWSRI